MKRCNSGKGGSRPHGGQYAELKFRWNSHVKKRFIDARLAMRCERLVFIELRMGRGRPQN